MNAAHRRVSNSLLVWAAVLNVAAVANAGVIHVPGEQPTIQAGIDATSAGDTVLVAPGTYSGTGNQEIDFTGKDVVVLSSGGPGVTTVQCHPFLPGFVLASGETSAAVLDGFTVTAADRGLTVSNGAAPTIRNCVFDGGLSAGGDFDGAGPVSIANCQFRNYDDAGLRFFGCEAGIEIVDCQISDNGSRGIRVFNGHDIDIVGCTIDGNTGATEGAGALIQLLDGVATVTDTDFIDNHAAQFGGGGLKFGLQGSLNVERCTFTGNTCTQSGGGLLVLGIFEVEVRIEECTFTDNEARWGGGVYIQLSPDTPPSTLLADCVFIGNNATDNGGGMQIIPQGTSTTIERCVVVGNSAPNGCGADLSLGYTNLVSCTFALNEAPQGAVIATGPNDPGLSLDRSIIAGSIGLAVECPPGPVNVVCSDIHGNSAGNWTGCLAGLLGTDGNISEDPLFCNPVVGDFTLDAASPCAPENSGGCGLIGASPVACGTVAVPRSQAPGVPVGLRVAPNPVLHGATFTFETPSQPLALEIFDPAGRLVEMLAPTGAVTWTPGDRAPRGVYFARLRGEGVSETLKFVVLK